MYVLAPRQQRERVPASDDRRQISVELDEDGRREVLAAVVTHTTAGGIDRLGHIRELWLRARPATELAQEDRCQAYRFEALPPDVADDEPYPPRRLLRVVEITTDLCFRGGGEVPGRESDPSDFVGKGMEDRLLSHLRYVGHGPQLPLAGNAADREPNGEKSSDSH